MKKDKLLSQFEKFELRKTEMLNVDGGKATFFNAGSTGRIRETGTIGSDGCGTDSTMEQETWNCIDYSVNGRPVADRVSTTYSD